MATTITYPTTRDGFVFDQITFDANKTDRVVFDAEVTDNPVEGDFTTDNVRAKPVTVSVDVLVTDYPLSTAARGALQQVQAIASNPQAAAGLDNRTQPGRALRVIETLEAIQRDGRLVLLDLGDRVFANMAIQSISVPRDRPLVGAFRIQIAFKNVKLVRSQTVALAQPTAPRNQPLAKLGKQTPAPATEAQARKSWAAQGADGVSSGFKKFIGFIRGQ